jgi:hypothetical protein
MSYFSLLATCVRESHPSHTQKRPSHTPKRPSHSQVTPKSAQVTPQSAQATPKSRPIAPMSLPKRPSHTQVTPQLYKQADPPAIPNSINKATRSHFEKEHARNMIQHCTAPLSWLHLSFLVSPQTCPHGRPPQEGGSAHDDDGGPDNQDVP